MLHQITYCVKYLSVAHFDCLGFTQRLQCVSCSAWIDLQKSTSANLPFRRSDRIICPCRATPRARSYQPHPRQILLSFSKALSFRFATDLLVLSHDEPPEQLIIDLKQVCDGETKKPLQIWSESEPSKLCCAASTAEEHLMEAMVALILVNEFSHSCPMCKIKTETAWRRTMLPSDHLLLIPVLIDENVRVPGMLKGLRSL